MYLLSRAAFLSLVAFLPILNAQPKELVVAAASDLAGTGERLAAAFEKKTGTKVKFSYGASGMLAQQIQQGAPFDVFISADDKYVRDVVRGNKADVRSARVFAHGRLALLPHNPEVKRIEDLGKPVVKRVALANPEIAPFGQAAMQVVYNKEMFRSIKGKLVYSQNVREAIQMAESGNVDAGFVPWSAVKDKGGILIDFALHRPLRMTAVTLEASPRAELAGQFIRFLFDADTRAMLTDAGYDEPTISGSPYKIVP